MTKTDTKDDMIMIRGARVSFPHLFRQPVINGEKGRYGAVLLLDPSRHRQDIATLKKAISELVKTRLRGRKLPPDKLCLRSGDDRGRPEYEGYLVLSANTRTKPVVIGTDGRSTIANEEDNPIYAGCHVNAKVRLWAQDNQYGKRINAELVAIQFAGDGEPLDGSYVSEEDAVAGFDAVDCGDADAFDDFDDFGGSDDDDDFMAA